MSGSFSRRRALASLGAWAAASPLLKGQEETRRNLEPAGRIAPRAELVNVLEFEVMAQRTLGGKVFSAIADGDRRVFDRMIFRPRMLVDTMKLDLSLELFGQKLFAPILVGPASDQQRFHPEGEVATARGADAGKAAVVISDRSSAPIEKIAAASKGTLWYQVYPQRDMEPVLARVQQAVKAGCKVICLTVGTPYKVEGAPLPSKLPALGDPHMNWALVEQLKQAAKTPVVLKGVMSAEEARTAVDKGAAGIIVSNHGGIVPGMASPIEVLTSVADAVGGRIPVLIDGGFRRGADILKALALGARAVLVTRPAMWGLCAYGSGGVQGVIELLQSELAGMMAGCGKPNLASLDRSLVRILKR